MTLPAVTKEACPLPKKPPAAAGLHYPATRRNREPIRAALGRVLPPAGIVLEIASGSGEHVAFFARHFPTLVWQPSDRDPTLLASISAHAAASAAANILPPVQLDVQIDPWPVSTADALIAINMIHVAPWGVSIALIAGAAAVLSTGGPLFLYGPFTRGGRHTAPSNEAFDHTLRRQDPSWGVRDLDDVAATALSHGLALDVVIEMPANNLSVVFRKRA
jgi:Protein of unknown function (DUF938)